MEEGKSSKREKPKPTSNWRGVGVRVLALVILTSLVMVSYSNYVTKRELDTVVKEMEKKEDTISSLVDKEVKLNSSIEEKEDTIENLKEDLAGAKSMIEEKDREIHSIKEKHKKAQQATRGGRGVGNYAVTCYDLSVQSCGKPVGSKGYGVTTSGYNLSGHSWESARAIAVDPSKIPLGSKVRLTFTDPNYTKYNGVYTAVDTGGAIKENKIDLFLGDFKQNKTHQSVWDFGRTRARVEILK